MGRFDATKAAIDVNIKKNDNQEITGSILNYIMNNMVDATEIQLEATDARIIKVSEELEKSSSEIDALITEVESQNEMIEDLQNTKIDKEADDYYPHLSVGLADNLVGVDVVDSSFAFRRSGGGAIADGNARIETIKGNSVVWNQLVEDSQFENAEKWQYSGLEGYELAGGEAVLNINDSRYGLVAFVPLIANHKYLVLHDVKASEIPSSPLRVLLYDGSVYTHIYSPTTSWQTIGSILSVTETILGQVQYARPVTNLSSVVAVTIKNPMVIDLTQMFGVGNEPTTIEEFNARKPLGIDENAYNEGEVIHMDAQSLESVGVNQWDEEWELGSLNGDTGLPNVGEVTIRSKNFIPVISEQQYYYNCPSASTAWVVCYDANLNPVEKHISTNIHKKYLSSIYKSTFTIPNGVHYIKFYVVSTYGTTYNHDICINLSDVSVNDKYFPYIKRTQSLSIIGEGLKSAGTAHDEIRYNKATQKWEKVQRVGSVDMGSLNWSYEGVSESYPHGFFYTNINTDLRDKSIGSKVLCPLYASGGFKDDKSIASNVSNNMLYVRDSSYTDAESFKAAMVGIILYYELAEPIVTILDDDFNLDYEVWNGGTEEVISDMPTTPLKADIAYGFNAVGKIKDLEEAISNLPSGESSVFEAKFKETSYEEVKAAFEAKKVVYCHHNNRVYLLSTLASNVAYFSVILGNYYYRLGVYPSNPNPNWSEDSKNFTHSLENLDNGNAEITIAGKTAEVATPQYVENAIQQSGTPSGDPMHYMFEAAGATYNATDADIPMVGIYGDSYEHKAKHWHLNELGDITNEEMRAIYVESNPMVRRLNLENAFSGGTIRTNIAIWSANRSSSYGSIAHTYGELRGVCGWSQIEVFSFITGPLNKNLQKHLPLSTNALSLSFKDASKLSKIIGCLNCSHSTDYKTFEGAKLLKEVRLIRLTKSFSFADSPLLSKNSVLFAIQNAEATSAITITLHADAYARLAEDADIVAALAEKTNVSLASA